MNISSLARIFVGCAGWSLSRQSASCFPSSGTQLQRYASRLPAVEINTSFYRPHQPKTYARWAEAVPASFRFAVKLPRAITHERRLRDVEHPLTEFFAQAGALGAKLGCVLVQLPPSLIFDPLITAVFLAALRERHAGDIALEPRHSTWFGGSAERLLREQHVARVAADPAIVPAAAEPGGDGALVYWRLHGSPRTYFSNYDDARLDAIARRVHASARVARTVWCIFDNTALGAALPNALGLLNRRDIGSRDGALVSLAR